MGLNYKEYYEQKGLARPGGHAPQRRAAGEKLFDDATVNENKKDDVKHYAR
jgi:hypothetical protein